MSVTIISNRSCKWILSIGFLLWILSQTIYIRVKDEPIQTTLLRQTDASLSPSCWPTPSSSPKSSPSLKWSTLESLLYPNPDSYPIALGCPPRPFLCGLNHVFDEVIILSLPRFHSRVTRTVRQLDEMGVSYRLIHARDGTSPEASSLAHLWFHDGRDRTPNIFSLFVTQLIILNYLANSPMNRILILEDDIIFHADFPNQFDTVARTIGTSWATWWLGVNMRDGYTVTEPRTPIHPNQYGLYTPSLPDDLDTIDPIAQHAGFYGAFAVGFQRDAATVVRDVMLRNRTVIDTASYIQILHDWPNQSFVSIPPLAIMDIDTDSTLRSNVVSDTKFWNQVNHIDYHWFDSEKGFWKGAEYGFTFVSEISVGFDRVGEDYKVLSAANHTDCIKECELAWPTCHAWTWNPQLSTCWLKYSVTNLISSESYMLTGTIQQVSNHPSQLE